MFKNLCKSRFGFGWNQDGLPDHRKVHLIGNGLTKDAIAKLLSRINDLPIELFSLSFPDLIGKSSDFGAMSQSFVE